MHDNAIRSLLTHPPAHAGAKTGVYLVHAVVVEVAGTSVAHDEAMLGKLVSRRLNRLQRVVESHGGAVLRKLPQGLLTAFDTAENAVLVACEMQRRCAVIPQISETQIGLRIGIHPVPLQQPADGAFLAAEIEAARLASLLAAGNIVVSAEVTKALPDSLRDYTAVPARENFGLGVHLIDWNAVPMRPAPAATEAATASPAVPTVTLTLRHGDQIHRFGADKCVITLGRAPENDVMTLAPNASRQHCRIIMRPDALVLVDLSMNGTYVQMDGQAEQLVRKSMITLGERGRIGFGHSCGKNPEQVFAFEIR